MAAMSISGGGGGAAAAAPSMWPGLAGAGATEHTAAVTIQKHTRAHFSRGADDWQPAIAPKAAGCIEVHAKPTTAELKSLDLAASRLWDLDTNRLTDDVHYKLDVGGAHRGFGSTADESPDPLFAYVDPALLDGGDDYPTYTTFYALLDNYSREVGVAEVITSEERKEEAAFLSAIMKTAPMAYVFQYLLKKGKLNKTQKTAAGFRAMLHDLWFKMYRRGHSHGADSSGFEHVFVGEVKNGEVSGFHNWVAFYKEEQRGTVDYKGYIPGRRSKGGRGAERRVAPEGGSYTRREFISYYHGTKEWDAAAPHEHAEHEKHLLTISFAWDGGKLLAPLPTGESAIACTNTPAPSPCARTQSSSPSARPSSASRPSSRWRCTRSCSYAARRRTTWRWVATISASRATPWAARPTS